jgi:peptidoglycan hydrolase-like protein with peptidoglycan-binding domain
MSTFTKYLITLTSSFLLTLPLISFAQVATLADASVEGESCIQIKNTLSYGKRDAQVNGEVTDLQLFLKDNGYLKGLTSGSFGVNTRNAVKVFQKETISNVDENSIDKSIVMSATDRHTLATTGFRLSNTGTVGVYTRAKIAYVTCHSTVPTTSVAIITQKNTKVATTSSIVPTGACLYDEAKYKQRGYKMTVSSFDGATWISINNMTLVGGKLYLLNKPGTMWSLWDVNTNQLTSTMLSCQDGVLFENGQPTTTIKPVVTTIQTSSQPYDPTFTSFTSESLAARNTIANDWVAMFNGALVPKVGDKTTWANGTITRLANGNLVYDVGNNTQTREFGISYDPIRLATEFSQLNQYWGIKYGINVAPTDNAKMGADANAYIHILMYGLSSSFTEQNTFQVGNSASGMVGVYKDINGTIMVKTLGGNFTSKQFESTNYYKALLDGGTTFNLTGAQQINRVWPPVVIPTTVSTWSSIGSVMSTTIVTPTIEVQRFNQLGEVGSSYSVKWNTTNAATVGWSCVAGTNGGYSGSGTFPDASGNGVNGSVSGIYTEAMLGTSRCTWHATSTQGVGSFGVFLENFTVVCPVGKVQVGNTCITKTASNINQTPLVLGAYSTSCVNIMRNLHRGDESVFVSKLQDFLTQKGFLTEKTTGFYGDKTVEAVKEYQSSKGLSVTGMVYDLTRQAVQSETCQ